MRTVLPEADFRTVECRTEGDARKTEALRTFGDKAVFVTTLETALSKGDVDVAVHSLKDLPLALPTGLHLVTFLRRDDPRDIIVSRTGKSFTDLPASSVVGSSSNRRRDQLALRRPDVRFADIRGNVETRISKLESGDFDAIVLAAAGVNRLGIRVSNREELDPGICTPAPGQGIIALECREDDPLSEHVAKAGDRGAALAAMVERDIAERVGANCLTSFGALCTGDLDVVTVDGWLKRDERQGLRSHRVGDVNRLDWLVESVASDLLA